VGFLDRPDAAKYNERCIGISREGIDTSDEENIPA